MELTILWIFEFHALKSKVEQKFHLGLKHIVFRKSSMQKFAWAIVSEQSKLVLTDFYYCAEQEFLLS